MRVVWGVVSFRMHQFEHLQRGGNGVAKLSGMHSPEPQVIEKQIQIVMKHTKGVLGNNFIFCLLQCPLCDKANPAEGGGGGNTPKKKTRKPEYQWIGQPVQTIRDQKYYQAIKYEISHAHTSHSHTHILIHTHSHTSHYTELAAKFIKLEKQRIFTPVITFLILVELWLCLQKEIKKCSMCPGMSLF